MDSMFALAVIACLLAVVSLVVALVRVRADAKRLRSRLGPIVDLDAEAARLRVENEAAKQELEAARQRAESEMRQQQERITQQRLRWEKDYSAAIAEFEDLKKQLDQVRDHVDLQSFGLYEPAFDFDTSDKYKVALGEVRQRQKDMVKAGLAAICTTTWTVGGSAAEGKKLANRNIKIQLRAFNGESDAIISKVNFSNINAIEDRLRKACDSINKLGQSVQCEITEQYLQLKIDELHLAHEYAEKKQAEREEQRRIKEEMRDEEQARRELERAQQEAEREEQRWADALEKARQQLAEAGDTKRAQLESKIEDLQSRLQEAHDNRERAVSRAQLTKSGHVYIISNEGSFGRDVYKVGMTRRLDPVDRVKELSDASVPFAFDIHAMIYSDDAPDLEAKLHQAFENRRVNLVNTRKEFFRVTLAEIEELVCREHSDVDFVRTAIAEEYRKTMAMRSESDSEIISAKAQAEQDAVAAAKQKFEALRVGWYAQPVAETSN